MTLERNKRGKKVVKDKQPKVKTRKMQRKVSTTLYGAFLIPIILMILLGIIAYRQTSNALIENFRRNITETFSAKAEYTASVMNNVLDKAVIITVNPDVNSFYNTNPNSKDIASKRKNIIETVASAFNGNVICDYYIFGKKGLPVESLTILNLDYYNMYTQTPEHEALMEKDDQRIWTGYHHFIDENSGASPDKYGLSMTMHYALKDVYQIVDINMSYVKEIVNSLDMGEGSVTGIVTQDGREILSDSIPASLNNGSSVFLNLPCYAKALAGEATSGFDSDINIDGKNYCFVFAKVGSTDILICGLVPKSALVRDAERMRIAIVIMVVLAIIISFLVATLITRSIVKAIKGMRDNLKKASDGDMTVEFSTNRKDEFEALTKSLNQMVGNTHKMLGMVAQVSNSVENSSNRLSGQLNEIHGSADTIAETFDMTMASITEQRDEIEMCNNLVSDFADGINEVSASIEDIKTIANSATSSISEGVETVAMLDEKMKATADITVQVIESIDRLNDDTRSINNIVSLINDLSSETNLLSLNASIEAARAGEAGRGFSVVAEEIRKLADQTMEAGKKIQDLVSTIQSATGSAVNLVAESGEIVNSQMEALKSTSEIFTSIANQVTSITSHFENIMNKMQDMDSMKIDTLDKIRAIAAMSEESSNDMLKAHTSNSEQTGSINNFSTEFNELISEIKVLSESLSTFVI